MNQSRQIISSLNGLLDEWAYINVLDAVSADALNEASLGRAYQHYLRSGDSSFGIVTYWLASRSIEPNTAKNPSDSWDHTPNTKLHKGFVAKLKRVSNGFFPMRGHGQEADPNNPGKFLISEEPSFWANGITFDDIHKLAKNYGQTTFTYSGPETDGRVVLYDKNGRELESWDKFSPMKIGQFYSKIKGHPFVFEYWEEGIAAMQARKALRPALLERIEQWVSGYV